MQLDFGSSLELFSEETQSPIEAYARRKAGTMVQKSDYGRLTHGMLIDALNTYKRFAEIYKHNGVSAFTHEDFIDVYEWVNEEDSDWLFSFEHCCDTWNINPVTLRNILREVQYGKREIGLGEFSDLGITTVPSF